MVGETLQLPSKTRWGYWIPIIVNFVKHKKEIRIVAAAKKWTFPEETQLAFLEEVYELLEPFGDALQELQRDDASVSKVFFNIHLLREHLRCKEVNLNSL